MAERVQLTDKDGNKLNPVTGTSEVYQTDTKNLDTVLEEMKPIGQCIEGSTKGLTSGVGYNLQNQINSLNTKIGKLRTLQIVISGTNSNNYLEVTIPNGEVLANPIMAVALLNSPILGNYVTYATRLSDTVIKVYFNQAITDIAYLTLMYMIA